MTIIPFGKGDDIYLPALMPYGSAMGGESYYSHPSYDWCYSHHGFACPLNYEGIPFEMIMEGALPYFNALPKTMKRYDHSLEYLLITHNGSLWKIGVNLDPKAESETWKISNYFIHKHSESWWIAKDHTTSTELNTLLGLLFTNPKEDVIRAWWTKYKDGEDLVKLSLRGIVERLNRTYPQS